MNPRKQLAICFFLAVSFLADIFFISCGARESASSSTDLRSQDFPARGMDTADLGESRS